VSDVTFPASSLPGLVLQARTTFYGDTVQEGDTGTEYRLNRTASPRYRYEYELRFARGTANEWQTLQSHFTTHGGRRESFLLVDAVDGVTRRVRFADPELTLDRIVTGVYSCSFELVTVGA
jgi:hypothetical protein